MLPWGIPRSWLCATKLLKFFTWATRLVISTCFVMRKFSCKYLFPNRIRVVFHFRQEICYRSNYEVILTSKRRHSLEILNATIDDFLVAMVTDLWSHWSRSMADSYTPPIFQWHYKLKFFWQKLQIFSNKQFFWSHLIPHYYVCIYVYYSTCILVSSWAHINFKNKTFGARFFDVLKFYIPFFLHNFWFSIFFCFVVSRY